MKSRRYLSIVLVIITLLSMTLSFANVAKDLSAPINLESIELTHHTTNYHQDLECQTSCDLAMMSCSACIVCINFSSVNIISHQDTLIKYELISSEPLYSVDLPNDQKPPIFS